jgi:hypothetical protein
MHIKIGQGTIPALFLCANEELFDLEEFENEDYLSYSAFFSSAAFFSAAFFFAAAFFCLAFFLAAAFFCAAVSFSASFFSVALTSFAVGGGSGAAGGVGACAKTDVVKRKTKPINNNAKRFILLPPQKI